MTNPDPEQSELQPATTPEGAAAPEPPSAPEVEATPEPAASSEVEATIESVASPEPAATSGNGAVERPAAVTAAAVLAFVLAAYEIAAGVVLFLRANEAPGPTALWYVVGILHIVFAGLMAWGGINALSGATNKILVLTAAVVAVVMVLTMAVEISNGRAPSGVVVLVLYAVMVLLVMRAPSKEFFAARAGSTL